MVIHFKKGKHQWKHKPDTLTCVRDDGSVTWSYLHRGFVRHDFAHYVIETTLGLRNAFFGLVAKGYDIPDFSEPKSTRLFEIPQEAMDLEPVVALLQADSSDNEGLFECHSASLPINITGEQLTIMRQKLQALMEQWQALQLGESIALQFKML